jgi:hypothetical protein
MAGLVPAIPVIWFSARLSEIAGTSPAMTRFVIASQRDRAKSRVPMTGSAKQPSAQCKPWIASSQELLAMTACDLILAMHTHPSHFNQSHESFASRQKREAERQ